MTLSLEMLATRPFRQEYMSSFTSFHREFLQSVQMVWHHFFFAYGLNPTETHELAREASTWMMLCWCVLLFDELPNSSRRTDGDDENIWKAPW